MMTYLVESNMKMIFVTYEMGFARTVAHRLVFMYKKLIVESAPSEKFNLNPESKTTKCFFNFN